MVAVDRRPEFVASTEAVIRKLRDEPATSESSAPNITTSGAPGVRSRVAVIGDAAHAMPPNLGQAANMAFINAMALALAVDRATDIGEALTNWEQRQRPLTNHVQWWSYVYGFVLGKWPRYAGPVRANMIWGLAKTPWFDKGLNRGARHLPDGYDER